LRTPARPISGHQTPDLGRFTGNLGLARVVQKGVIPI
jgi:hypothetical protein